MAVRAVLTLPVQAEHVMPVTTNVAEFAVARSQSEPSSQTAAFALHGAFASLVAS